MKTFDIAVKDLKHIFMNVFSLVMMFAAPLLIAGLIYFAFGSMFSGGSTPSIQVTKVAVANLDQPEAASGFAGGKMLVNFLQDKSLANVISVTIAESEAAARVAVNSQKAGVAIIIPPDFSAGVTQPGHTASVSLYSDPTLTIAPGLVKALVSHYMDSFSGAKITSQVTLAQLSASGAQPDPAIGNQVIQQYTAWLQSSGHEGTGQSGSEISIVSPVSEDKTKSQGSVLIGPIMAGMMIFFVFFMGANGAESIIREDEQGTLSRLFTTPTSLSAILGGKFLGVVVTLCIQVILLMLASSLLFGIQWGQALSILLVSTGLIVAAAGFGVMVMAFIKNSRQTGPVLGGVMTLTGMLGGLMTTSVPNIPAGFQTVNLFTPQGWALQGWKLALAGAGPESVLVSVLVLLGMGLAFLAVAIVLFRKRFA